MKMEVDVYFFILLGIFVIVLGIVLGILYRRIYYTDNSFPSIIIINLKRRPERANKMRNDLIQHNFNYTFFEAIDGHSSSLIPFMEDRNIRCPGRIGCWLSHVAVWKYLYNIDDKNLRVIIEDDVKFLPVYKTKILNVIYDLNLLKNDWDICYLTRLVVSDEEESIIPHTVAPLVYVKKDSWQMAAYIINPQSILKLINLFKLTDVPDTWQNPLNFTIDTEIIRFGKNGSLKCVSLPDGQEIIQQICDGSDTGTCE